MRYGSIGGNRSRRLIIREQCKRPCADHLASTRAVGDQGGGQIEAAADMFQAFADSERLRLLLRLAEGEACVSELAEYGGEKITTVSARLKTLFTVRLVKRRREAKHIFYALADEHVLPLVHNAIDHAAEGRTAMSADPRQGKEDPR